MIFLNLLSNKQAQPTVKPVTQGANCPNSRPGYAQNIQTPLDRKILRFIKKFEHRSTVLHCGLFDHLISVEVECYWQMSCNLHIIVSISSHISVPVLAALVTGFACSRWSECLCSVSVSARTLAQQFLFTQRKNKVMIWSCMTCLPTNNEKRCR